MITSAQPTRITGYASGAPVWRVTLQREDREGRTLSYLPELATTQGSAPDFATAHLFRGFRPRLEITWSVGMGSALELWDGAAWTDGGEILTAAALLGLLSACEDGDLRVEPWRSSTGVGAFWARCWSEAQEIRDIKGVLHSGLKITFEGAGGDLRSGTVDGDAQHTAAGIVAQIPDPRAASNTLYIRVATPAAAWDRSAVYLYKPSGIYLWNPDVDTETLWAPLPAVDGAIYDLQISNSNLHLLTQKIITADANGDHGESIQTTRWTRPLDGSSGWTQDDQWGWVQWWGPGWNDLYCEVSLTFAGGKTWYVGAFRWHNNPSIDRGGRSWISGESAAGSYMNWRPQFGVYYASADRTLIGGFVGGDPNTSGVIDANRTSAITIDSGYQWLHVWTSGTRMAYWSDSVGVHAASAVLVGDMGVGYTWQLTDHIYPGATLSAVPPVPFADRSLLILSDGSGLWWDGSAFTPEPLGNSGGRLVPVRYGTASATSTTGHAVSLQDGSVLHVG